MKIYILTLMGLLIAGSSMANRLTEPSFETGENTTDYLFSNNAGNIPLSVTDINKWVTREGNVASTVLQTVDIGPGNASGFTSVTGQTGTKSALFIENSKRGLVQAVEANVLAGSNVTFSVDIAVVGGTADGYVEVIGFNDFTGLTVDIGGKHEFTGGTYDSLIADTLSNATYGGTNFVTYSNSAVAAADYTYLAVLIGGTGGADGSTTKFFAFDNVVLTGGTGGTHLLIYAAGDNGTISGDTNQTVAEEGDGTPVTAVADSGYGFWKWSDDRVDNPRTDTNVTAGISVAATFYAETNTLTYIAGANGSIPVDATQQVALGEDGAAVLAVPDSGYRFFNWSDGGTNNPRQDLVVISNLTFTADFVPTNQVPVVIDITSETFVNMPQSITLYGQDLDNDPLTYQVVSLPTNGTLSTTTSNVTIYTPNSDYMGTDTFTYKVNDGVQDSLEATVSITVSLLPEYSWTGSADADWWNAANWVDGFVPQTNSYGHIASISLYRTMITLQSGAPNMPSAATVPTYDCQGDDRRTPNFVLEAGATLDITQALDGYGGWTGDGDIATVESGASLIMRCNDGRFRLGRSPVGTTQYLRINGGSVELIGNSGSGRIYFSETSGLETSFILNAGTLTLNGGRVYGGKVSGDYSVAPSEHILKNGSFINVTGYFTDMYDTIGTNATTTFDLQSGGDHITFKLGGNFGTLGAAEAATNKTWFSSTGGSLVFSEAGGYVTVSNASPPITAYDAWAALYPTLSNTDPDHDEEPDGMDNLMEYALGGNPTNSDAASILPVTKEGAGVLSYIYNRQNPKDPALTYEVLSSIDLVFGPITNTTTEVGVSEVVEGFESVTNQVSTAVEAQQFMQLKVQKD